MAGDFIASAEFSPRRVTMRTSAFSFLTKCKIHRCAQDFPQMLLNSNLPGLLNKMTVSMKPSSCWLAKKNIFLYYSLERPVTYFGDEYPSTNTSKHKGKLLGSAEVCRSYFNLDSDRRSCF